MHHNPICGRKIIFVHEGRYRHVEKTFNPSDPDLHRSHRAVIVVRSATAATSRSAPRVLWARALASYVGRWLWLALLVDVPTDDAVHDWYFRCHLLSRSFSPVVFVAMGAIIGGRRRGCGVVTQAIRRCRYSMNALREGKSRRTNTQRRRLRSSRVDSISKGGLDRAAAKSKRLQGLIVRRQLHPRRRSLAVHGLGCELGLESS